MEATGKLLQGGAPRSSAPLSQPVELGRPRRRLRPAQQARPSTTTHPGPVAAATVAAALCVDRAPPSVHHLAPRDDQGARAQLRDGDERGTNSTLVVAGDDEDPQQVAWSSALERAWDVGGTLLPPWPHPSGAHGQTPGAQEQQQQEQEQQGEASASLADEQVAERASSSLVEGHGASAHPVGPPTPTEAPPERRAARKPARRRSPTQGTTADAAAEQQQQQQQQAQGLPSSAPAAAAPGPEGEQPRQRRTRRRKPSSQPAEPASPPPLQDAVAAPDHRPAPLLSCQRSRRPTRSPRATHHRTLRSDSPPLPPDTVTSSSSSATSSSSPSPSPAPAAAQGWWALPSPSPSGPHQGHGSDQGAPAQAWPSQLSLPPSPPPPSQGAQAPGHRGSTPGHNSSPQQQQQQHSAGPPAGVQGPGTQLQQQQGGAARYSPSLAAWAAAVLQGTDSPGVEELLQPLEDAAQRLSRREGEQQRAKLRVLPRERQRALARLNRDGVALAQAERTLRQVLRRPPTLPELARAVKAHPTDVAQRRSWALRAKKLLVAYNKGFVYRVAWAAWHGAKPHELAGLSLRDLAEEGLRGLLHALDKYEPDAGNTLGTYATPWIQLYVQRGIINQAPLIRIPNWLHDDMARLRTHLAKVSSGRRELLPPDAEMARALGWTVPHLHAVRRALRFDGMASQPTSLEAAGTGPDSTGGGGPMAPQAEVQRLEEHDFLAPEDGQALVARQRKAGPGDGDADGEGGDDGAEGKAASRRWWSTAGRNGAGTALEVSSAADWVVNESIDGAVDGAILEVLRGVVQQRARHVEVTPGMVAPLLPEGRRLLDLPSTAWGSKTPSKLVVMPEGCSEGPGAARVKPVLTLSWNSILRARVRREVLEALRARLGAEELGRLAQVCGLGAPEAALAPRGPGGAVRKH